MRKTAAVTPASDIPRQRGKPMECYTGDIQDVEEFVKRKETEYGRKNVF